MNINTKKLPKSQLEIEFELTAEEFDKYIDHALSHLQEHIKVDGFRRGQVPKKIVEEKLGQETLLMEAGDLAVKESYSKFVSENNIEPISQPEVQILKVAKNNPFLFKIKITILPEVILADYKKIASRVKKNKISVEQNEIDDSLAYLRKTKAKFSQIDRPCQEKDFVEIEYESPQLNPLPAVIGENKKIIKDEFILGEGGFISGFEKNIIGMKAGETKEFSVLFPEKFQRKDFAGKEVNFKVKMLAVQKTELPEINDEFAKSLGNFENLSALKNNIKEGIILEKETQEKQRIRDGIIEKIAEKSKFELPEILIESEKERLFEIFKEKITENFKITFQDYLASVKQDEKTLKSSFVKEAEKRVKNFLILREIGKKESIYVADEEVEKETNNAIKNYSVEALKKIDIQKLKDYTKDIIYNEKVLQKLETLIKN